MKLKSMKSNERAISEIISVLLLISIVLAASVIFIPNMLRSEHNLLLNMSHSEEKQSQRLMEALTVIKSERYATDLILWVYNYGIITNVSKLFVDNVPTPITIMRDFNASWQTIYLMNPALWSENWISVNMNLFSKNNASIKYYNTSNSLIIKTSPTNSFSEFGFINKILYGYAFAINSTIEVNSGIFLISLISADKTFSSTIIFNSTSRTVNVSYNSTNNYRMGTLNNSQYNIVINFSNNQIQFKVSDISGSKTYKINIPYYKRNDGYYVYLSELASPSLTSSTIIYEFTISGMNINPLTESSIISQGINAILIKNYGWAQHSITLITSTGNIWRWIV
ncbi:MAG: archaellin/type IV pilin N-terminal domain-containing protein [Thermoprotei archaeon]